MAGAELLAIQDLIEDPVYQSGSADVRVDHVDGDRQELQPLGHADTGFPPFLFLGIAASGAGLASGAAGWWLAKRRTSAFPHAS